MPSRRRESGIVCPLTESARRGGLKGELMLMRIARIIIASLSPTIIAVGQPSPLSTNEARPIAKAASEVELALTALGAGTTDELKRRLLTDRSVALSAEYLAQARAALPEKAVKSRITRGPLHQRVEAIFQRVLQLLERSGKVELFLYQADVPGASLWRGCVMLIADNLASSLYDSELAGVIAHELGHANLMDEMADAWQTQDRQAMRVVELKCDAFAMLALKLLGYAPGFYLNGIKKLEALTLAAGRAQSYQQTHPALAMRAEFAKRFLKLLAA